MSETSKPKITIVIDNSNLTNKGLATLDKHIAASIGEIPRVVELALETVILDTHYGLIAIDDVRAVVKLNGDTDLSITTRPVEAVLDDDKAIKEFQKRLRAFHNLHENLKCINNTL